MTKLLLPMGDCICGGKLVDLVCQSCSIIYKVGSFEGGHFLSFEIDDDKFAEANKKFHKQLSGFCVKCQKIQGLKD